MLSISCSTPFGILLAPPPEWTLTDKLPSKKGWVPKQYGFSLNPLIPRSYRATKEVGTHGCSITPVKEPTLGISIGEENKAKVLRQRVSKAE